MDRVNLKPNSRDLLQTNFRLKMERAGLTENQDWNFINPSVYSAICIILKNPENSKLIPLRIEQIPVHVNPLYTKMH